jgi:Archaeal flagella assembly protein J
MAGIATSGLSRSQIFEYASKLPYSSAGYFKKIHFLARKLNYDYAEACRIVGEETKEAEIKGFLLRFSGSLTSGEPEADFLAREAYVVGENYGDGYEREVELLRTWTDAYTALILSAAVIVVMGVVSMMIYPTNPSLIITLSGIATTTCSVGTWILYRAAPKEIKTHSLPECSKEQKLSRMLFKICLPAAILVCSILALMGVDLGWIMIAAAAFVLPPGLLIVWDDRKIDKRDSDIAGFLRSLGSVAKMIGATLTESLSRLDLRSVGSLQQGVRQLHSRLCAGIKPDLCWWRFISETGSELVNRSTQIFWDGVSLGGDPQEVGKSSSMFAMKIALLRAKRRLVSNSFSWLCIAMHAALCGLMVLIYQIMLTFSSAIKGISSAGTSDVLSRMPTLGLLGAGMQLDILHSMVIVLIVVFTGANAFAIKATEGGHSYKFLFYLSIMLAISGVSLVFVPQLASMIFGGLPAMG